MHAQSVVVCLYHERLHCQPLLRLGKGEQAVKFLCFQQQCNGTLWCVSWSLSGCESANGCLIRVIGKGVVISSKITMLLFTVVQAYSVSLKKVDFMNFLILLRCV